MSQSDRTGESRRWFNLLTMPWQGSTRGGMNEKRWPRLTGIEKKHVTEAKMQIEISTDSNIEGREKLAAHIKDVVESALNRFRGGPGF